MDKITPDFFYRHIMSTRVADLWMTAVCKEGQYNLIYNIVFILWTNLMKVKHIFHCQKDQILDSGRHHWSLFVGGFIPNQFDKVRVYNRFLQN